MEKRQKSTNSTFSFDGTESARVVNRSIEIETYTI